jgi:hypothetical protein
MAGRLLATELNPLRRSRSAGACHPRNSPPTASRRPQPCRRHPRMRVGRHDLSRLCVDCRNWRLGSCARILRSNCPGQPRHRRSARLPMTPPEWVERQQCSSPKAARHLARRWHWSELGTALAGVALPYPVNGLAAGETALWAASATGNAVFSVAWNDLAVDMVRFEHEPGGVAVVGERLFSLCVSGCRHERKAMSAR